MILSSASSLSQPPKRIISLVPSQTELLHYLGLEEETIGITKFCIHPNKWFQNKIRVGGTKNIDIQKITDLNPDLIIANREENVKEQVAEIARHFPVWVTDVPTLEDAYRMIGDIGQLSGKTAEATALESAIKFEFDQLAPPSSPVAACYLIWKDPYMTIGGNTFINDMMRMAGFKNVFAGQKRYPEVSAAAIKNNGAKVLLLSSEPYPFKQKHLHELQEQLPGMVIMLVDGELFSWYGSRLLHSPAYFRELGKVLERLEGR